MHPGLALDFMPRVFFISRLVGDPCSPVGERREENQSMLQFHTQYVNNVKNYR